MPDFIVQYVLTSHFLHNKPQNSNSSLALSSQKSTHEIKLLSNTYINRGEVRMGSYYVLLTHSWPQWSFVRRDLLFLSSPFCIERAFVCHGGPRQRFSSFPLPNRRIISATTLLLFVCNVILLQRRCFLQIEFLYMKKGVFILADSPKKRVMFFVCGYWYLRVRIDFVIFIWCDVLGLYCYMCGKISLNWHGICWRLNEKSIWQFF